MAIKTVSNLKNKNRDFNNVIDSYLPLQPENGADAKLMQFDGTEVARVHDGAVVPTASGTSTSLSAGTGFKH